VVLSMCSAQLGMDHSRAVKMATDFKQGMQGVGKYFELLSLDHARITYFLQSLCSAFQMHPPVPLRSDGHLTPAACLHCLSACRT
jgi:hypothetical protein